MLGNFLSSPMFFLYNSINQLIQNNYEQGSKNYRKDN